MIIMVIKWCKEVIDLSWHCFFYYKCNRHDKWDFMINISKYHRRNEDKVINEQLSNWDQKARQY